MIWTGLTLQNGKQKSHSWYILFHARQAFQVPGQRDIERVSDQAFIKDFGPWTSQELTGISAME